MERVTVEFVQKELYQPRKDFKRETWFALSNTILENPDFFHLNPLEFKALIYLYCQASKARWKETQIVFGHAKKFSDIERDTMMVVIDLLIKQGKLRIVEPCSESVRQQNVSVQKENVTSEVLYSKETKERKKETKLKKEVGETPATPKTFEIIHELQGYEPLDQVLCSISTKTQKQWLTRYKDPEWVKQTLSNAVDYYNSKANGEPVTEWPQKLISWLARDKSRPTNGQTADPFAFLNDEESA